MGKWSVVGWSVVGGSVVGGFNKILIKQCDINIETVQNQVVQN